MMKEACKNPIGISESFCLPMQYHLRARLAATRDALLRRLGNSEDDVTLTRFMQALDAKFSSFNGHPMRQIYFDFASSSLDRGREAVKRLGRITTIRGKEYLDVGTAYGGFPAAFAMAGAKRAVGIEYDPQLLELAKELRRDCSVEFELLWGDCLSEEFQEIGPFDIITCNDVIEHVADPWMLMNRLSSWLRPGGWLFLEIPNYKAIDFVFKDGHYGLFGICLLDRSKAMEYYARFYEEEYTVGEYLDLLDYPNGFRQAGVELWHLHASTELDAIWHNTRERIDELERDHRRLLDSIDVPDALRTLLSQRIDAYLVEAREDLKRCSGQHEVTARRDFSLKYGTQFWSLVGRRVG